MVEKLHIFVVMFENMFNPTLVRQAGRQVYEGTQHTTIKTFKSGETNSTIKVERPPRFVQRAYADVQSVLKATVDEVIVPLDARSSFHRNNTEEEARPHNVEGTLSYFEFPLVKMSNVCTFKPDRAQNGEFYTSDPSRLLRLTNYLSSQDEWLRTTKSILTDYIVETPAGVEHLLSDLRTSYKWH